MASVTAHCPRCTAPYGNERAYCLCCGHVGRFYEVPQVMSGSSCFIHPTVTAIEYCTQCRRPICAFCEAKKGTSIMVSVHTPQCAACVAEYEILNTAYERMIRDRGFCPVHPHTALAHTCVGCAQSFCLKCLYITTRGFFVMRPDKGPFCFQCFYTQVPMNEWRRQMPATNAKAIRFLKDAKGKN